MNHSQIASQYISNSVGGFIIRNKPYHTQLPIELRPWHCYTTDSGHTILAILKQDYMEGMDPRPYFIPVPVKSALRGHEIREGLVICDIEYNRRVGLAISPQDEEL